MTRLYGRAPQGVTVPFGHWKIAFVAALRHDRAPWLIDGPINGVCFLLYVENVLVPPCAMWVPASRSRVP
jgi:hypothetical protein